MNERFATPAPGHPALRDGLAALRAGDAGEARRAFEQVPPGAGASYLQARQQLVHLLHAQDEPAALRMGVQATALALKDPTELFQYGETLFGLPRYELAMTVYQRVVALDPTYTDAFIRLGMVCRERRDLPRAIQQLEQALQLDPRAMIARFVLALICVDLQNYPRALSQLHFVLQHRPDYLAARMLRVDLHQRLGDHRQALVELCELANEGSRDAQVYLKLATSLAALGDQDQLHLALARVCALDSRHVLMALKLAARHEEAGDLVQACHYYAMVLSGSPEQAVALAGYQRVRESLYEQRHGEVDEVPAEFAPELEADAEACFAVPFVAPEVRTAAAPGTGPLGLGMRAGTSPLGGRPPGTSYLGPDRRMPASSGTPIRRQVQPALGSARGTTRLPPPPAPTGPLPASALQELAPVGEMLGKLQQAATDFWQRARVALDTRPRDGG